MGDQVVQTLWSVLLHPAWGWVGGGEGEEVIQVLVKERGGVGE